MFSRGLFGDLAAGAVLYHAWTLKGWYDVILRYRRTVLGPFWMVASTGLMIACLSVIGPVIFGGGNPNFIVYLATGIICWTFISLSINELTATFIDQADAIRTIRMPFSMYVYRVILRNVVVYVHLLVIYIFVAIYFAIIPTWHILLFCFNVLLVVLNFIWLGFVLGMVCARYRDIQQVVGSLLTIGFLLTPVFWDKTMLLGKGARSLVLHLNPLMHMLEILRAPLLLEIPTVEHYVFLVTSLVIGALIASLLFNRYIHRVVFWL